MTRFDADVNGHEFSLAVTPTLLGSHVSLEVDGEVSAQGHALFFVGTTVHTQVDGEAVRAEVRVSLFGVTARLFVGSCEVSWSGDPTTGRYIPVKSEATVRAVSSKRRR